MESVSHLIEVRPPSCLSRIGIAKPVCRKSDSIWRQAGVDGEVAEKRIYHGKRVMDPRWIGVSAGEASHADLRAAQARTQRAQVRVLLEMQIDEEIAGEGAVQEQRSQRASV